MGPEHRETREMYIIGDKEDKVQKVYENWDFVFGEKIPHLSSF